MQALFNSTREIPYKKITLLADDQTPQTDDIGTDSLILQNKADIGIVKVTVEGFQRINTFEVRARLIQDVLDQLVAGEASDNLELIKKIAACLPAGGRVDTAAHQFANYGLAVQKYMMLGYTVVVAISPGMQDKSVLALTGNAMLLWSLVVGVVYFAESGPLSSACKTSGSTREAKLTIWKAEQERHLAIQARDNEHKDQPWIQAIAYVTAHGDASSAEVSSLFRAAILLAIYRLLADTVHLSGEENLMYATIAIAICRSYYMTRFDPVRFAETQKQYALAIEKIPATITHEFEVTKAAWAGRVSKFLEAIGVNAQAPVAEAVAAPEMR
jgi:hypothetical protein